ncbi:MAG: hypothetical protein CVT78_11050 [Alphaproteobacteria bacterium HGW-Alphaproteobacteria-17]|nr:MAG: hypothetical protein CVT78_11050 [Alphaproteobacteria bacterium HGW-Alphaproteobacteria-17]
MIEMLRKAHPGTDFASGVQELEVTAKGGAWEEATINLHRIYLFCQTATEADCDTIKSEFVGKIGAKPQTLDVASLRIIVRDEEYVDYARKLGTKPDERQAIYRPIGEDLFALLASDGPETIALVGDKGLAELGLSESDAWDRAWRQTRSVLPTIPEPAKFREQAMAFESKEYLASITADLPAWQKVSDAVGPDLFMTVVSDQFVFVGPMPNGPNLEAFRTTVEEDCRAQPRCVSPNIYRFRDGQWVIAR